MRFHANAALSLKGRRVVAQRAVVEGWTVTEAAAAAEVRCAARASGLGALLGGGRGGLVRSFVGAGDGRQSHRRVEGGGDRGAQATAGSPAREIAETLGMALSTVSGDPDSNRAGPARPAVRYERARLDELVHVDVKKLGRIQRGAGERVRDGLRQHYNRTFTLRTSRSTVAATGGSAIPTTPACCASAPAASRGAFADSETADRFSPSSISIRPPRGMRWSGSQLDSSASARAGAPTSHAMARVRDSRGCSFSRRFSNDPEETAAAIRRYADLGFDELVLHEGRGTARSCPRNGEALPGAA
jgi:hypothetical protein